MTEVASELENMPELVIVSGMSGAGRTEAMHAFEDLGYFCVDNLPSALIGNLLALTGMPGQPDNHRRIAVVCDARSGGFFKSLMEELSKLKSAGVDYRVLFLDADDEKLIARYKSAIPYAPTAAPSQTGSSASARCSTMCASRRTTSSTPPI
mgnify:CR=1 FL=1